MDNISIAKKTMDDNYNCCQSVLSTYAEMFGLDKDISFQLGAAFTAGIAYQGNTCGAVIGAYLVIGLLIGNTDSYDDLRKELTYSAIREFTSEFIKRNKSFECRSLLAKDVSIPDELDYIIQNKLFDTECPMFVCDACEILDNLIKKYKNGK